MSLGDDDENSLEAYLKTKDDNLALSVVNDDEDSLGAYLKEKNSDANLSVSINEDEFEEDKKEEEEIFQRYERIGSLTDIKSIRKRFL